MANRWQTIQAGDLLAYLEGVAPEVTVRLIEQSPELLAEAASLDAMDALLISAFDPASAFDMDDLLLYQAGLLDPDERLQIEQQLAANPAMLSVLEALILPAELTVALACSLLPDRPGRDGQQIMVAIRLPVPAQPALPFHSSKQHGAVYQAGDYQVLLVLAPLVSGANVWSLEGQISSAAEQPIPAGAEVQALRDNDVAASDRIDASGFFALEQLDADVYTIRLDLADTLILIENVSVA